MQTKKLVGKMAQLMPSVIRMACRSHIHYDEDDLILWFRDDSIEQLNRTIFIDFSFIQKHIFVLENMHPADIRKFIKRKENANHVYSMPFCRYAIDGKNMSCCSCVHVREIIDHICGGNNDEQNRIT